MDILRWRSWWQEIWKLLIVVGSERQLFEKKLNCFAFAVCKCARAASFLAHAWASCGLSGHSLWSVDLAFSEQQVLCMVDWQAWFWGHFPEGNYVTHCGTWPVSSNGLWDRTVVLEACCSRSTRLWRSFLFFFKLLQAPPNLLSLFWDKLFKLRCDGSTFLYQRKYISLLDISFMATSSETGKRFGRIGTEHSAIVCCHCQIDLGLLPASACVCRTWAASIAESMRCVRL